jgi:hypothetical protein
MPSAGAFASTHITDAARALALEDGNSRTDAVVRLYHAAARAAAIAPIGRLVGRSKEPVVLKPRSIGEMDLKPRTETVMDDK